MNIKRYVAPDMRRALKKVSEDLGSEAVILSNRKTAQGVELWASGGEVKASEVPAGLPDLPPHAEQKNDAGNQGNIIRAKRKESQLEASLKKIKKSTVSDTPNINAIKKEMASFKEQIRLQNKMLTDLMQIVSKQDLKSRPVIEQVKQESERKKTKNSDRTIRNSDEIENHSNDEDQTRKSHNAIKTDKRMAKSVSDAQETLVSQFRDMGLSSRLANYLVERRDDWTGGCDLLASSIKTSSTPIWSERPVNSGKSKFVALLGPTGVGKTTTIAKLALRFRQSNSVKQMALVTLDPGRLGSKDYLNSFAKQLGCDYYEKTSDLSLNSILKRCADKCLVLIDTIGYSVNDRGWHEQQAELLDCEQSIYPCLVLPSTQQRAVLEAICYDYQRYQYRECIISKLDECVSLGEVLNTVVEHCLTVKYVTDGTSLTDDLHQPDGVKLVQFAEHLGQHAWQHITNKMSFYAGVA